MFTKVNTTDAPAAIGPYSQAIKTDKLLYTSGQIPIHPETGEIVGDNITDQTERVCKNISAVLKEANSDFDKVIKTTCFLADMSDFAAFNDVYSRYFISAPARSCVAVKALPRNALVEIELIAEL